jgi:hypothetical protein
MDVQYIVKGPFITNRSGMCGRRSRPPGAAGAGGKAKKDCQMSEFTNLAVS